MAFKLKRVCYHKKIQFSINSFSTNHTLFFAQLMIKVKSLYQYTNEYIQGKKLGDLNYVKLVFSSEATL